VLCGGERVIQSDPELQAGYYLSPCILTDVTDDMEVAREEIFGSVACLFPFSTEDEVIRRANDTPFGLAGGVFTRWVVSLSFSRCSIPLITTANLALV